MDRRQQVRRAARAMRDAAAKARAKARARAGRVGVAAPTAVVGAARPAVRLPAGADLLVPEPVFLLSSVRSGSTLLRMMLDSHPDVLAPHEMHLGGLRVKFANREGQVALELLGFEQLLLENMLWDRVFAQLLAVSGKSIIVDKTPSNTLHWERLADYWPDARYLFLLRHPLHIAESLIASRADVTVEEHYARTVRFCAALHEARSALTGLSVRYEDLTGDPTGQTRRICAWLGVPWQESMIDYRAKKAPIKRGLGDWSATLKSGEIRPPQALPTRDQVPDALVGVSEQLGYL